VPQFETSSVTTSDGAELAVYRSREAESALLMLHGFTLDHTAMLKTAAPLVRAGLPVVLVDLRGHGDSSLGSEAPDLARLQRDVVELVDSIGLRRVTVVGHSLGAYVSLGLRSDSVARPFLSGVVAISAMPTSLRNPFQRVGAELFSSGLGAWLLAKPRAGRSFIRTWYRPGAGDLEIDETRVLSARCPVHARRDIGRSTRHIDLRTTFARPGPPTLLLCGTDDRATPCSHSREIGDAIGDAEVVLIPDAGHMVVAERPDAVAAAIAHWMRILELPSA
jgi:3-oxoadipate enol-lactonase